MRRAVRHIARNRSHIDIPVSLINHSFGVMDYVIISLWLCVVWRIVSGMTDVEIELNPVAPISITSSGDGTGNNGSSDVGAGETVEVTPSPILSPTAATAEATGAVHTDEVTVSVAIEQPVSSSPTDTTDNNNNGGDDTGNGDAAGGDDGADDGVDDGAADGEHKTATKKKKKKKGNRERQRSQSKKNIVVNQGADLVIIPLTLTIDYHFVDMCCCMFDRHLIH
jgi:hypothetical protein